MTHNTPAWPKATIFYQIFPDRFAKSTEYKASGRFDLWGGTPHSRSVFAGNLLGIVEHLDYIQKTGFDGIYLCPIVASASNHRYHAYDYFQVDPVLGTMEHFYQLRDALHKRGMRLLLDGVFNHCGRGLYQFHSLLELGQSSPYRDWFKVHSWPIKAYGEGAPNYDCWWGIPDLPKFNTENPEVREFLFSVAEFWTRQGIDGWRLDVPNEINDDSFWQEFRRRVCAIQPNAYIVGEIWENPDRWLQGDQFDAVMNYPVRRTLLTRLFPEAMANSANLSTGEPPSTLKRSASNHASDAMASQHPDVMAAEHRTLAAEFCAELESHFPSERFGTPFNLLGSHDSVRLATIAHGQLDSHIQALAVLFFLPGTVCLFAGDEWGQKGGKDPDNRQCFDWQQVQAEKLEKNPVAQTVQHLAALRKRLDALQQGTFGCTNEGEGVLLWREYGDQRIELRVAWPGRMGVEPGEWRELGKHKTDIIPGHKGFVLQPGGWHMLQRQKRV